MACCLGIQLVQDPACRKGIAHRGLVQLTIKTHPSTCIQANLTQIIPHSRLFRLCQNAASFHMCILQVAFLPETPDFPALPSAGHRHQLGTTGVNTPPFLPDHGHHPQRIPLVCPFYRCKVKVTGEGSPVFISKITASSVSTWGHLVKGLTLRAAPLPSLPLCQSPSTLGKEEIAKGRWFKEKCSHMILNSPTWTRSPLSDTPLQSSSLPPKCLRAELRASCCCFCESWMIIICIKFDCLNCSGLIGTNTRSCALPVISDSLANAFCKIALDFNNRLLVLECCAHFLSNSWCPRLC